jgi:hypothetical protein
MRTAGKVVEEEQLLDELLADLKKAASHGQPGRA